MLHSSFKSISRQKKLGRGILARPGSSKLVSITDPGQGQDHQRLQLRPGEAGGGVGRRITEGL